MRLAYLLYICGPLGLTSAKNGYFLSKSLEPRNVALSPLQVNGQEEHKATPYFVNFDFSTLFNGEKINLSQAIPKIQVIILQKHYNRHFPSFSQNFNRNV